MAKSLNIACESGRINTDKIEEFQKALNRIHDHMNDHNNPSDSHVYLIYEVQALIFWVRSDKDSAREFLESAIIAKGDGSLYTQSARNLIKTLGPVTITPWYKKNISAKTMWILTLITLVISPLLFWVFLIIAIILSVKGSKTNGPA